MAKHGKHIFFDLNKKDIKFTDSMELDYKGILIGKVLGIKSKKKEITLEIKFYEDKIEELKGLLNE